MNKDLTLTVIETLQEAERQYWLTLKPEEIPVTATRINWSYLKMIVEDAEL